MGSRAPAGSSYRAYLMGRDGHILHRVDITCVDDAAAEDRALFAEQMVGIVSHDLSPSNTAQLDKRNVLGFATGDVRAGSVMTLMVSIGVLLRFVQEWRTRPRSTGT